MSECVPSRDHICPECKAGKHGSCDGTAWCRVLDDRVRCVCTHSQLSTWTIYRSPLDAPGKFVTRRWEIQRGTLAPREAYTSATLAEARSHLPAGLVALGPDKGDDPSVVESWI